MTKVMKRTDSELGKIIGKTIAKYRHSAELTQAQVAEKLGISDVAMSRIERGKIMPTATRLVQLADILNCEASALLQETSPLISDQTQRIIHLLARLEESDRGELIDIIENMVQWHLKEEAIKS